MELLSKNKANFFPQEKAATSGDMKQLVLKNDCRLFSQLFISCQAQENDLLEFFQHENQSFPAVMSESEKFHTGQKLQLAKILEPTVTPPDTRPQCDTVIIDGSSILHSLLPKISKTFEEYAVLDVVLEIQMYSLNFMRTDVVFDVYWTSRLKQNQKEAKGINAEWWRKPSYNLTEKVSWETMRQSSLGSLLIR